MNCMRDVNGIYYGLKSYNNNEKSLHEMHYKFCCQKEMR